MLGRLKPRLFAGFVVCLLAVPSSEGEPTDSFPRTETLTYQVEWRLITAGYATLKFERSGAPDRPNWKANLRLESTGLVSKLYKIEDTYSSSYDPGYCADSYHMISSEGKRRRDTVVTYERDRKKAVYLERDLIKNTTVRSSDIDVPACVHDVIGGLMKLRSIRLEPGKSIEIPTSDGKKFAMVRIEAQEREDVKIKGAVRKTMRYEAFIFNNVIYSRKARLQVWITEDAKRTPVQFRLRTPFPVGTVSLTLEKEEYP